MNQFLATQLQQTRRFLWVGVFLFIFFSISGSVLGDVPTVGITIDEGSGFGTSNKPLVSPTVINASAYADNCEHASCAYEWRVSLQRGFYCAGQFGQMWFGSEPSMQYNVGLLSSDAVFRVTIRVTNGAGTTEAYKDVYIDRAEGGCYGGGDTFSPPSGFSLTSEPSSSFTPGQKVRSTLRASSSEAVTFRFYAATTSKKPVQPLFLESRNDCSGGCSASFDTLAPQFSSRLYLWADASNSEGMVSESKVLSLNAGGGGGSGGGSTGSCTDSSWASAPCGTKIDAGCYIVDLTGGETLGLSGKADHPDFALGTGGAVIPVQTSYSWEILDSGGIAQGLQILNPDRLEASLLTPVVSARTTVTLKLTGEVSGCTAADTLKVVLEPTEVAPNEADLSIELRSVPGAAGVGDELEIPVTVRNAGPFQATEVEVALGHSEGFDILSGAFGFSPCREKGSEFVCSLGSVGKDTSRGGTFRIRPVLAGSWPAVIVVRASEVDPNSSNNRLDLPVESQQASGADLRLTTSSTSLHMRMSEVAIQSFTVHNSGPLSAPNSQLVFAIPANLEFVEGQSSGGSCGVQGASVFCSLGSLAPESPVEVSLSLRAIQVGSETATVSVASDESDPETGDNQLQLAIEVTQDSADLQLSAQTSSFAVKVGETVNYTLMVSNKGPKPATKSVVRQAVGDHLSFVSGQASMYPCTLEEGTVVCQLGTVEADGNRQVSLSFEAIRKGSGEWSATASSLEDDPVEENNTVVLQFEVEAAGADLSVEVPEAPQPAPVGGELLYTLLVSNSGPEDAYGVTVSQGLPEHLEFVSYASDEFSCNVGEQLTCSTESLASGASAAVELRWSAESEGEVNGLIQVTADEEDPDTSNNSSSLSLLVTALADLSISLDSPDLILSGGAFGLRFLVQNKGPSDAEDVSLSGELPEAALVTEWSEDCQIAQSQFTCETGSVGAGTRAVFEFLLQVEAMGQYALRAELGSETEDPDTANNVAEASLVVQQESSLIFPHNIEDWDPLAGGAFTGLAVFNPGERETDVEFRAFDREGRLVDTVLLSQMGGRLLPPGGQIAKTTREITNQPGVASITVRGVASKVEGFFLLGDRNLSSLDGVGGNLFESDELFFPFVAEDQVKSTKLVIYNPDAEKRTEVTLTLHDLNGNLLEGEITELAGGGSLVSTIEGLFGTTEVDGYVRVRSDHPLKGFQMFSNGREISTLAAQVRREVQRLVVPHFFSLGEDGTRLRFLNVGDASSLISLKAYDDLGRFLDGALLRIEQGEVVDRAVAELMSFPDGAFTGYLVAEFELDSWDSTEGAESQVIGLVSFSTGNGKTLTTLPLVEAGQKEFRFLHVAQSKAMRLFTGMAALNSSQSEAQVSLRIYDADGLLVADKQLQAMAPGSRIVGLLNELLGNLDFEQVGGHFEVVSDQPIVVFAMFGDLRQQYLSAINGS